MPEAIAVLLVTTICVGLYIFARVQALDPSTRNVSDELKQMQQHRDWLQERLERAKRENWDVDMVKDLHLQMAQAARQLESAKAPVAV